MKQPAVCLSCGGEVRDARADADQPGVCRCPHAPEEAGRVQCPACGGSVLVGARACPYCSSTLATRRCSSCLAWNLAEAAHCQACGRPLAEDQGSTTDSSYACPRCGYQLVAREYAETSVDECDGCGGLFLAPAMMERVVLARDLSTGLRLALPKRQAQRETAVKYIRCPVCSKVMNREAFGRLSGVVVDVCKTHGVWFDAGELAAVIQFVEKGGLERARKRELEEIAIRERRLRERELALESGESLGFEAGGVRLQLSERENPQTPLDFLRFIADLWRGR
jgi:Zn-finger nucleic acid-binding protein